MLNELGFYRPTENEILDDLKTKTLKTFGYDTNVDDTGNIGKILSIMAYMLDNVWQDVEGSYYSAYVGTAAGTSLDRVATMMGVSRELQSPSTVTLTFTGTVGYVIKTGFVVATESGIVFTTLSDATIDINAQAEVIAQCQETGMIGNVKAGKVNVIVNPVAEIISVINNKEASGGKEKENDSEFRERISQGVGRIEGSTIDAMLVSIMELSSVMSASVISNDTNNEVEGRPPHSFEVFVYGGNQAEIANTIFLKKPIGIQSLGDVSTQINDIAGNPHTILFSRPTMRSFYVKVKLTVNSQFSTIDEVKTAIIKYVGGLDIDQAYYFGTKMHESCIYMELVKQIMNVGGIDDMELTLSENNTDWVTTNIDSGINEVLELHHQNVMVEVVNDGIY